MLTFSELNVLVCSFSFSSHSWTIANVCVYMNALHVPRMCGKSFYKTLPLCCVCSVFAWINTKSSSSTSSAFSFKKFGLWPTAEWVRVSESPPRDIELTINVTVNCIVHIFFDFVVLSTSISLLIRCSLFTVQAEGGALHHGQFHVKWSYLNIKEEDDICRIHA